MLGHGHVTPRPDGVKARCGGPAICKECAREQAALKAAPPTAPAASADAGIELAAAAEALLDALRPRQPRVETKTLQWGPANPADELREQADELRAEADRLDNRQRATTRLRGALAAYRGQSGLRVVPHDPAMGPPAPPRPPTPREM